MFGRRTRRHTGVKPADLFIDERGFRRLGVGDADGAVPGALELRQLQRQGVRRQMLAALCAIVHEEETVARARKLLR